MSPSDWGLVGGIAGAVLGLIGGIVGTWCSIRNTAGKRERALMVRLAAGFWAAMAVLGAAAWVIPAPFKVL
nr:hypothetical protein [bacterium]